MKQSETIGELAKALVKFQSEVENPKLNSSVNVKTTTGGSYAFKYATIGEIKEKIAKPLAENGLSYSQLVGKGGAVTTILMHTSGEWISSQAKLGSLEVEKEIKGEIVKVEKKAQEVGSLITYTKRYSLSAILGLVTEEDDDGNTYDGNSYKYKKTSAKAVGIKSGTGEEATEAQLYRLGKLSKEHGFKMKASYTKAEASGLISKYLPKN